MVTPSSTEPSSEMVGVVDESFLEEDQPCVNRRRRQKAYSSLTLRAPDSEKETFLACRSISLKMGALTEPELCK